MNVLPDDLEMYCNKSYKEMISIILDLKDENENLNHKIGELEDEIYELRCELRSNN